jgi:glycosyltransferase involved in cell wall biosynthesis
MKIAYVHSGLWPSSSPSMTFATFNAIGLAERADCCYYFIRRNSSMTTDAVLEQEFDVKRPDNLIVYQGPRKRLSISHRVYFWHVYNQLVTLIKQKELDAVISRSTQFLPFLAKIRQKYHITAMYETHNFYADLSKRDDKITKSKKRNSRYERLYIPKISAVACLQKHQKDLYSEVFPNQKLLVARTGIHKITRGACVNNSNIAYTGSFDKHKGLDILLQGAALSRSKPEVLIIGGKNKKELAECHQIASAVYQREKVKITGWLNKKDFHHHLSHVRVGIIPLQSTFFNRYITSPLKLFDFFSYGIPVICSDLPTMRELVVEKKTGLFYQTSDAHDLAEKIDFLLQDKELYKTMKKNIYDAAEQYLWERRAEQLIDFIRSIKRG